MRVRPPFLAVTLTAVTACWFAVHAQQSTPSPTPASHIPIDPADVTIIANDISLRSEHLKPMLEQVHAAEWVAKGAPDAYVAQWRSLTEQNQAIQTDMAAIAQNPQAMEDVMKGLFRVHRFDSDLGAMLNGLRRYQNPALADLIESVAAADQNGVEKLQQYVLDLADEKERQIDVEDKEAQRCRATLAAQPLARPAGAKTTNGTSK
jgi:hypothetical protein